MIEAQYDEARVIAISNGYIINFDRPERIDGRKTFVAHDLEAVKDILDQKLKGLEQ